MHDLAGRHLLHSGYPDNTLLSANQTGIGYLTARLSIERRLRQNNQYFSTFGCQFDRSAIAEQSGNLAFTALNLIADEFGFNLRQVKLFAIPGRAALCKVIFTGTGLLFFHVGFKACNVDGEILFRDNILRQVNRESIGIIQLEDILAAQSMTVISSNLVHQLTQQVKTLADGLVKSLFLIVDNLFDIACLLGQLRVSRQVLMSNRVHNLIEERDINTQQLSMTCRSSEQTTQDITAAFIGGSDTVCQHKSAGTDMVGNDAQRDIGFFIFTVVNTGNLRNLLHNVLNGINLKQVVDILHNAGNSFQTHTGVDIGFCHPFIVALAIGVKLRENQVPELDIAVTVATGAAIRFTAAACLAAIKVDLRTGAAGTGTMFPEVVFLAETDNPLRGNADFFCPDIKCFVIILINGDPQTVDRQFQHLGDKFPRPGGRFMFKVIAEREVTQHLKIGAMACGLTDMFDILGTDTFLTGGHAGIGRSRLSEEKFFQRCHAGVDQQKAGIIFRGDQGGACHTGMALAFEEGKVFFAQVI